MAAANALISSGVGFLMVLDNPKMVGDPEMPDNPSEFALQVSNWIELVEGWREEHLMTEHPNLGLVWLNERLNYLQDRIVTRL
jgi:hypothetical protein